MAGRRQKSKEDTSLMLERVMIITGLFVIIAFLAYFFVPPTIDLINEHFKARDGKENLKRIEEGAQNYQANQP